MPGQDINQPQVPVAPAPQSPAVDRVPQGTMATPPAAPLNEPTTPTTQPTFPVAPEPQTTAVSVEPTSPVNQAPTIPSPTSADLEQAANDLAKQADNLSQSQETSQKPA